MSVNQIVVTLSLEQFIGQRIKLHYQISRLLARLLVTLSLEDQLLRVKHTRADEHINAGIFLLYCATIKSNNLALVFNLFLAAAIELPECNVQCDGDVVQFWGFWFIQSAKSSAEHRSFKFKPSVVTDVKEWVHLEEKVVKNLVAVVLVLVAATEHSVRSLDASAKGFFTILLIDSLQLGVAENLVSLADQLELRLIHTHLLGVLHGMHLE